MINRCIPLLFILFIYSCSSGPKDPVSETNEQKSANDTIAIMNSFIPGLWSLDSQNILNNEGYFFKPDGTVDFVASEASGEWELIGTDSLKLKYTYFDATSESSFHIDSLTESRMVLSDSDDAYLFRKVPYGVEISESVIAGYSGQLTPGNSREYSFMIPSAKKLRIALNTASDNVRLKVFDERSELTSVPVKDWQSIMVRSGNYKILVDFVDPKKARAEDYSIKVYGQ
jgi:hypothetical protein